MGCYIETPFSTLKARQLAELHGAERVLEPATFTDIPPGKTLVCVVENFTFDAVGVCLTAADFRAFKYDGSGRPRTWMLIDAAIVRTLVSPIYVGQLP